MARVITNIVNNSENELFTAMMLKKLLGVPVQKAISIAKRTSTQCVPPITVISDLSTDELLEQLDSIEINVTIINQ